MLCCSGPRSLIQGLADQNPLGGLLSRGDLGSLLSFFEPEARNQNSEAWLDKD